MPVVMFFDFRIPGDGCGNRVHRVREHERLGARHVYDRNELIAGLTGIIQTLCIVRIVFVAEYGHCYEPILVVLRR